MRTYSSFGIETHQNYFIPPNCEQPSGTIPPAIEGVPEVPKRPDSLDQVTSTGPTRHSHSLQVGRQVDSRQTCVWNHTAPARFAQTQGSHAQPSITDTTYVSRLKEAMQSLVTIPPRQLSGRPTHVSEALSHCSHVFVRFDVVKKPLQQPYNGPYHVLSCSAKQYTIDYNGRPTVVSLDRLKAAHIDLPFTTTTDTTPPSPPPPSPSPQSPLPSPPQSPPSRSLAQTFRSLHLAVHWGGGNGVAAHIDICTLHFELVLEHSVLARVSHVYAQHISVIVYAYNQSCLGNVHNTILFSS